MKKNQLPKPTEGELEILQIIWEMGPSTVKSVNQIIRKSKEAGYTTTLKLMQIMFDKGLLSRIRDGKTHIYASAVSQEKTQRQLLDKFVDAAFQGSAMNLVMQLLGNRESSKKELDQIRVYLDKIESNQRGK